MKRRLRKKLHKKYIHYIIDLSHAGNANNSRRWRTRLMTGAFFDPQLIDKITVGSTAETGYYASDIQAIRQYNLKFLVTKLPGDEYDPEEGSFVTFRFQSFEFPEILFNTYNNVEA